MAKIAKPVAFDGSYCSRCHGTACDKFHGDGLHQDRKLSENAMSSEIAHAPFFNDSSLQTQAITSMAAAEKQRPFKHVRTKRRIRSFVRKFCHSNSPKRARNTGTSSLCHGSNLSTHPGDVGSVFSTCTSVNTIHVDVVSPLWTVPFLHVTVASHHSARHISPRLETRKKEHLRFLLAETN